MKELFQNRYFNKYLPLYIIILTIVVLLGTSYALLRSSHTSSEAYTINVGLLEVDFFGTTNTLTINNMVPMTDEEGMEQNDNVLNFTVKNTGQIKADYSVYIEETSTSPEFKSVIRYSVNKADSGYGNTLKLTNNMLYIDKDQTLDVGGTVNYKVKFWLDYDADKTYMNKTFSARIVIDVVEGRDYELDGYKYYCGSQENVYCINSYEDLVTLRDEVNAGDSKSGKTYVLTKDIDMGGKFDSEGTMLDGSTNWTPIGTSTNSFSGTFDGNGHIITNLYINSNQESTGFFGVVSNGTIRNLEIEDSYLINNFNNTGMIAGQLRNSSLMENCYNAGTVIGQKTTGGMVAHMVNSNINNSYNFGKVSSSNQLFAGGIVGYIEADVSISNTYNAGVLYNVGLYSAGIVGGSKGTIANTYNVGEINGTGCAGILGQFYLSGNVSNSHNVGTLNCSTKGGIIFLINPNGTQTLINNFYLNTTAPYGIFESSNNNFQSQSDNGTTPLPLEQMPSVLSVINSDNAFVEDTNIINNGYPILKWQAER